jgi:glycyl-tRNA synthetase beta chain
LVTGMVGEFPELQGVIGGYLANAQGEPNSVSDAIRDHYKPAGQGDEVPAAPASVAVSLAEKLDTLVGFFGIDQPPTGSRDPFALRRAALSAIRLITDNGLRIRLLELFPGAAQLYRNTDHNVRDAGPELLDFLADRLKVQQREAGVRHDLIDAVFALGGEDDLVRLLARVTALQAFVETDEGANLLTAYKRAANILKKEKWDASAVSAANVEPAEAALAKALAAAEPKAKTAVEAEDFTAAMAALASLRAPIDAFFDKVTVNDADGAVRARRLNLLARFRDAVHQVADFSKIEG